MDALVIEFIISIICFLGLFVGLIIGKYTKEELKEGRKYFLMLMKALFILIVFYSFYDLGVWWLGLIFLVLFSLVMFSMEKFFYRTSYAVSAVLLVFSFFNLSSIIPYLVFFYSFPAGTLVYYETKKNRVSETLKKYYLFLVVIVVLFAVRLIL
ncbi:MAG: hypothetical protein ABH828_04295 [archaeon]